MSKCKKCRSHRCNCKVVINKPVEIITKGRGRDGLDAYELAVLEGFIGTREEWIESLHGKDGGTYLVDEEDITIGENLEMRFKDRVYEDGEGLGYKILRLEGGNTLTSSDFEANTVHEIRYDFDLDGETIEMPENVTLKFKGGSLNNGEIVGLKTKIEDTTNEIFGVDVEFSGEFSTPPTRPEWFGAKSYDRGTLTSSTFWWSKDTEAYNGVDSSDAFNRALELAQISGGRCIAEIGIYKVTNTVTIPRFTELTIPSQAGVFVVMEGEGNVVYEADIDEPSYSIVQNGGDRPITLKTNQYFGTECMAVGFRMDGPDTKITGGGVISVGTSSYTIAVLLEGNPFWTINMMFEPEVDIKIIGGSTNRSIPDPDDYVIDLPWDDPAIIDLGEPGEYAYSTLTGETRVKNNAGTAWAWWANKSEFNTAFRCEVLSNDNRIINLKANVFIDWGFRGIEIVGRDGGWFNQAVWSGTVSDMHSNYVSFFGSTIQGLSIHDMTLQSYQIHPKMSSQCRIFAIYGYVNSIESGNTWDLTWAPPARVKIAYELGQKTRYNKISFDGVRYLKDEGHQRGQNYVMDDFLRRTFIPYKSSENILKFDGGRSRSFMDRDRKYIKILDPVDVYDTDSVFSLFSGTVIDPSPLVVDNCIFDESGTTHITAADTTEGGGDFNGIAFRLFTHYNRTQVPLTVTVDLRVEEPDSQDFLAYVVLGGLAGRRHMVRTVQNGVGSRMIGTGGVHTLVFPQLAESAMDLRTSYILIYTPHGSPNCKINLVNVRVFGTPNYTSPFDIHSGPTSMRPNACPKGHTYYDTTISTPVMNVGDSSNQEWQEIPTEESGTWEITSISGMTSSNAEYSKIGKQVSLSGLLSFSGSYTVDTNVQIVLPFTPKYGGTFVVGDLTFTLANNSTTANVKSSTTGNNKPFNLHFKTA